MDAEPEPGEALPMSRHRHVVHLSEVEAKKVAHGDRFEAQRRKLGAAAGSQSLGASHMVVPPGKTAWPAHYHAGNEEGIFILSGEGAMRLGDERVPVRAGDWIALPAAPLAHQLINTGSAPLEYLCVSTQNPCDVAVYPDSGKVGVFGGAAPGGDGRARFVRGFFRASEEVPYYAGE